MAEKSASVRSMGEPVGVSPSDTMDACDNGRPCWDWDCLDCSTRNLSNSASNRACTESRKAAAKKNTSEDKLPPAAAAKSNKAILL